MILLEGYTQSVKEVAQERAFLNCLRCIGDGVCALYDIPRSKLRLYCIRYGSTLIIAGDGAVKPKGIRALQEDERLKEANYLLRRVSKAIKDKMLLNEIKFCNNSYDFKGELDFEIDCYEKK